MIDVEVIDIQPHPDYATNNTGWWAVRFRVAYEGTKRTFWRWHNEHKLRRDYRPGDEQKKPAIEDILRVFWTDTFLRLTGFTFDKGSL